MYLASMNLPGLGRSLLTGVFWSAFPPYIFGTTRTKNINYAVTIKNASEEDFSPFLVHKFSCKLTHHFVVLNVVYSHEYNASLTVSDRVL